MKLTVIGAGPAYTDRAGAVGASYLVTSGDTSLLLDLGHGSFANLAGALEPSTLTAIAISHLHPDHFIDLVPLRHYLRYEFEPPRRLAVLAPAAIAERLDALLAQPGFTAEALDIAPLSDGLVREIGGLRLEARKVTHTDDSYAFRVSPLPRAGAAEPGPGLVYTGDCGRAADLRPLIQPGDVLLSEVSFGLGPVPRGVFHLDAGEVGRLAADAGAGRVLLTHLLSGRDRAATEAATTRAAGGIEATLVDPGDRFDIQPD
ncbi:MAG TPA: MBL fold metallo-hydrolase [Candidatus Limnocylindrales bacterium]|jgi:ribonuclease BN (tRNA processing enzyme)